MTSMQNSSRLKNPALYEVMEHFMRSQEFRDLSPATQDSYAYLQKYIAPCKKKIATLGKKEVDALLSPLKNRPGLYRRARSVVFRLATFALENGWRDVSLDRHAASGTRSLGEIDRWPDGAFQHAVENTQGKLLATIALAYYTSQRLSDIVHLKPAHRRAFSVDGESVDRFEVTQKKTGNVVYPPVDPALAALLPDVDINLYYIGGRAFPENPNLIRDAWRTHATKIGLKGLTIHGLRKTASCEAAEGGASIAELMALLGHASEKSSAIYFRQANRGMLADGAMRARARRISGGQHAVPFRPAR